MSSGWTRECAGGNYHHDLVSNDQCQEDFRPVTLAGWTLTPSWKAAPLSRSAIISGNGLGSLAPFCGYLLPITPQQQDLGQPIYLPGPQFIHQQNEKLDLPELL